MKKLFPSLLSTVFAILIFATCKKTEEAPADKPPVAKAGVDATIILPIDSITLDGSSSSDPDGNITYYQWTKISGPDTFNIVNASTVKTHVKNLKSGIYLFQLQVTDSNSISAKIPFKLVYTGLVQLQMQVLTYQYHCHLAVIIRVLQTLTDKFFRSL